MNNKTISLLVFHGSIKEQAVESVKSFVDTLSLDFSCNDFMVCFLRATPPDLLCAMKDAKAMGAAKIKIIPLLILPGSHITQDIPQAISEFSKLHPEVTIETDDSLIKQNDFLNLIASRLAPWNSLEDKAKKCNKA